jgi:hopanoid biosynthesis associated RND transporter like protein HpnN
MTSKLPEPGFRPLTGSVDAYLGRLAAAWVNRVQHHAGIVILFFLIATVAIGVYAGATLGVNSSEIDLFSKDLRVMKLRANYFQNFPLLRDPIVVVVDAATPDLAHDNANKLAERLRSDPGHFVSVYQPDGGEFFDEHALLYLSVSELQNTIDRLSQAQPFLSRLSRDQSIGGLFTMLDEASEAADSGELEFGAAVLGETFNAVSQAIDGYVAGRETPLSWQTLLDGRASDNKRYRRFLLVTPVVDFSRLGPADETLQGLRDVVAEPEFNRNGDVRVRTTGTFPLAYEESEHIREQATWAGLASLVLVTIILLIGFGSLRLVFCCILTLLVGLVWTAGFASAAIGYLNLISIAFGVLFIGLSIDFAIHLSVQFSDELGGDARPEGALRGAASSVGGSLAICALTTSLAFFAFVPTEFTGVGELGLIAGTGMFIGLFVNFTLLPAMILTFAPRARVSSGNAVPSWMTQVFKLPMRYARSVLVLTTVFAIAALFILPALQFDSNPIRVRDPSTSSVQVFDEILEEGLAYPWNLNAAADDLERAREMASILEARPEIRVALTLSDFVPGDQEEKLEILDDAVLMLLPSLSDNADGTVTTAAQAHSDIDKLEKTVSVLATGDHDTSLINAARGLRESLVRLREKLGNEADITVALERLHAVLFESLPGRLRLLRRALQTDAIELDSIPEELRQRMTGLDGRARIEVFPEHDLSDQAALEAYVAAVQTINTDTFGEGLLIVESGKVVIQALRQALTTAAIAILLILTILWRNVLDAALVAAPLVLATIFTTAGSVVFDIPFNFANVIIIPLLLGMGIDSSIHMVHRVRGGNLPDGNLLRTGTARAVLLSALTTMASFGTLGFSSHRGIASLGQLLTLGIALVLLCNLVVLPALVKVTDRIRR